jgi:hypothetical protein
MDHFKRNGWPKLSRAVNPSLVTRLVAIVAIAAFAGLMLFVFRDETRNKLSDILPTIAPFCKVSGPETSAYQTDMAVA